MRQNLALEREDATIAAAFREPAFRAFYGKSSQVGLVEGLWRRLSPLGLALTDITADEGNQLGRVVLAANLDNYGIQIRVRYGGLEVWANVRQLGYPRAAEVNLLAMESLSEVGVTFKTHTVTYQAHGHLVGGESAAEFVARRGHRPPEGMGPVVGSQAAFYFGAADDRLSSAVNLDLSGAVRGALYFRVDLTLDATKVAPPDVAQRARAYVTDVSEKFGLVLGAEAP